MAYGPSFSVACGILLDQGLNPCLLHWEKGPLPLRHQGSPKFFAFKNFHWYSFCSFIGTSSNPFDSLSSC